MTDAASTSFFAELKRRRVGRVAIAYAGVAMGVLEVADLTFDVLIVPDSVKGIMVLAALAGFPVVLVLTWLFDVTEEGIKLTPGMDDDEAPSSVEGRASAFGRQFVVAGVVVILAMSVVGWRYLPNDRVDFVANQVAMMRFENQAGDPGLDDVGVIAATDIGRGLSRLDGLLTVPVNRSLGIPDPGLSDPGGESLTHVQAVANATKSRLVVLGSYYVAGDELVFQAAVYDAVKDTELYSTDPIRGGRENPTSAFEELREGLFGFLGNLSPALESEVRMEAALHRGTPTYAAYREAAVGYEAFAERPLEAAERFAAAATIDTTYADAMYLAAVTYWNGGRVDLALPWLARLEAMRADLSPYTAANLDFYQAFRRGDLQGTYTASGRVAELARTSPEAWTAGTFALAVNRPYEAIDHFLRMDLERMGPRWPNAWGSWRAAQHRLGQHRRELRLAKRALAQHPDRVPGLLAALAARGKGQEVWERLDTYDLGGLSNRDVLGTAEELEAHDDAETAQRVRAKVMEQIEASPTEVQEGDSLRFERGLTLLGLGRDAEALAVFHSLLERAPQNMRYRTHEGVLAARLGDRDGAEAAITWLGELTPSPRLAGGGSTGQARIAAALGEAERAVSFLRQAEELGSSYFNDLHRDPAFQGVQDHPAIVEYMEPRDAERSWWLRWLPWT